jgi:hypothetical protein
LIAETDFCLNLIHKLIEVAWASIAPEPPPIKAAEEKQEESMSETLSSILAISMLVAIALPAQAQTQAQAQLPNLSGTYRCQADPAPCTNSGQTFTVSQTGAKFEAKSDKGDVGAGAVTSKISVSLGPPWNTLGVILPDNKTIEWSAGTKWLKQ